MFNKHKICIKFVVPQTSSICIFSCHQVPCWGTMLLGLGHHLIHRYLNTVTWLLSPEMHLPLYSGGQNFHGQACGSTWQAEQPPTWGLGQGDCNISSVAACITHFSLHARPEFQHEWPSFPAVRAKAGSCWPGHRDVTNYFEPTPLALSQWHHLQLLSPSPPVSEGISPVKWRLLDHFSDFLNRPCLLK